jgi:hypothetical protein
MNKTMHKGVIYWKSTITGATGHSTVILEFSGKVYVKDGNLRYPELHHWFIPIMQTQEMN